MLGDHGLVLCVAALKPAPFAEHVRVAAEHGFDGISIWRARCEEAWAEGLTTADMRRILDEHGVDVTMLEFITAWAQGPANEPAIREEAAEYFALARELGASQVLAVAPGTSVDLDEAAAGFALACDLAAPYGLTLAIEFLPIMAVNDLRKAWTIVERADRANGGLLIDSWHWQRSGPDPELLRTIPAEKIVQLQLNDAAPEPEADLRAETMQRRLLPGEGVIDLGGLIGILNAGGVRCPVAAEVYSDRLRALPPSEAAGLAAAAVRRVLGEAAR